MIIFLLFYSNHLNRHDVIHYYQNHVVKISIIDFLDARSICGLSKVIYSLCPDVSYETGLPFLFVLVIFFENSQLPMQLFFGLFPASPTGNYDKFSCF
jgi:hypothetical protein